MSPSQKFKMPIIGKIETKEMDIEWTNQNGEKRTQHYESESYEVIAENDFSYICNKWYKEHNDIPQLVPKSQVRLFIKL